MTTVDTVQVAGLEIAYRRAGNGPPLVLLHGAVCDSRVWRPQLDALCEQFTVIAWDAPGCGGSSDPPESFRLAAYADCLTRFLAAIDIVRPHVLGHSWGSSLALELYRQRPEVPATLILVGAYAGWAGSLPAAEVAARLAFALEVANRDPCDFDPTSMRGLFSDAMAPAHVDELVTIMSEIRPAGTRAMAYALAEADLRDMLGSIAVPTLLLYGDADERAPLGVANALHAAIPTSKLKLLRGLGHECCLEDPDAFNEEVRRFVRSGHESAAEA